MELEHGRFNHRPGLNKGLDKNLSGFSSRKTIFDTTVYLLLGKISHPKSGICQ